MLRKPSFNFFLLILFCACSRGSLKGEPTIVDDEPPVRDQLRSLEFNLVNSPGQIKLLRLPLKFNTKEYFLRCDDSQKRKIEFFLVDDEARAYLAESYFSKEKKFHCDLVEEIKNQSSIMKKNFLTVTIQKFSYPKEKLNVDKKRVFLSKEDQARAAREWRMMKEIYQNPAPHPYFQDSFRVPLDSVLTSKYGTKRIFNNKKQTQHLGNDFRAAVGVPIPVSNRGRVVFAGNLFYSGNTVVVDHGAGIFTVYAHLSKIHAIRDEIIPVGEIVGEAGATGRVTGPHLHWGVKINGHWLDGFSLVNEGV